MKAKIRAQNHRKYSAMKFGWLILKLKLDIIAQHTQEKRKEIYEMK
jgi:hypothetical protein